MAISLIFFIGVSADLSELSPMLIPSLIFSYATSTANQFFIARPVGGSGGDVDDSGVIGKAIGAAAKVGRAIVNFKNEHHDAYLIASTILCTLLSFLVLGLIMLVVSVIVGIIVFVFVGSIILGMLNNSDSTDSRSKIYEVWEDGYKRTLTYDSYAYSKGDRYIDDNGDYWITEDNGKTFYRE